MRRKEGLRRLRRLLSTFDPPFGLSAMDSEFWELHRRLGEEHEALVRAARAAPPRPPEEQPACLEARHVLEDKVCTNR